MKPREPFPLPPSDRAQWDEEFQYRELEAEELDMINRLLNGEFDAND